MLFAAVHESVLRTNRGFCKWVTSVGGAALPQVNRQSDVRFVSH